MVLDKQEIRERMKLYDVWVTQDRTALLPVAVVENRMRYIVQIRANGNAQAIETLDVEKLEEDASYTMKFSMIPVAPAATVPIPENFDIEQPIIVLQGGSQLYGTVSGLSLQVSTHYWDDEI